MENPRTNTEKDRIEKKIDIAIDKIIDVVDMGYGDKDTEEILERLRTLSTRLLSN